MAGRPEVEAAQEVTIKVPFVFSPKTTIPYAYRPTIPLSKDERIRAGNQSAAKKAEDLSRYERFKEKGLYD